MCTHHKQNSLGFPDFLIASRSIGVPPKSSMNLFPGRDCSNTHILSAPQRLRVEVSNMEQTVGLLNYKVPTHFLVSLLQKAPGLVATITDCVA